MRKSALLILVMLAAAGMAGAQTEGIAKPKPDPTPYVNVFIGTNGMGHTFPGACYPNGSVQLSPDTDTIPHNIDGVYQPRVYDYCAGYQYRDNTIVGFSHTHFSGTGHSDLGDILIMPYSGRTKLHPGTKDNPDRGYRQRFRHETESASPGYYAVTLDDDSIRCELTATPHCGVQRYTYAKGAAQKIILDLQHGLYNYDGKTLWAQCNVLDAHTLVGYRLTNGWSRTNYTYFCIHFSKPIKHFGCRDFYRNGYKGFWNKFDTGRDFPEMGGRKLVTWFEFEEDGNDTLEIVTALSATGIEGAKLNMEYFADEYTSWPVGRRFEPCLDEARLAWQQRMYQFELQGTDDQKGMFYTSLYHCFINPSLYQDCDGKYRGIDGGVHQGTKNEPNYTVFSVWDTYRAFHPLLTLLDPKLANDIVLSFYSHASQSPHKMLPVWSHMGCENWCMIGYHGVSVVADALQKGIPDEKVWSIPNVVDEYLINTANCDYYGNTNAYKMLGYVPVEYNANGTSITLENAYEDWCIYSTLKRYTESLDSVTKLDYGCFNAATVEEYRCRAMNYRNVFDRNIGFVRGRHADGSWKTPYSLLSTSGEGLVEGNSWNYSFYVPHDVKGMIKLMGGDRKFVRKLDTLFTMHVPDQFFAETEDVTREGMLGGYVQGNEPSHHIPYLYMWSTQPWKTQYWVREIMNKMYRNHMDGLCGNDDCGQMSAWYIFSAMGFYPVCPGSGEYVLGAPYMPYLRVRLGNGSILEVKAPKVSDKNRYIQKVTWNGKPWTKAYVTHDMLMQGGVLEFDMGPRPNKKLFQSKDSKPYSLTQQ